MKIEEYTLFLLAFKLISNTFYKPSNLGLGM